MTQLSADSLRYCVTYLAWALPLTGWIALALFAPQRSERFTQALRARFGPRLDRAWGAADAPAGGR
ncbi:MAG: hypothetical protein QOI11_4005, partial [Candidatus Eremiobacteraeota bacterium]|nr:hypothetical protein [Candidatus Eremiobacteraeota bacterium]